MMDRQNLLEELENALASGTISAQEVRARLQQYETPDTNDQMSQIDGTWQPAINREDPNQNKDTKRKLSAAEVMFYIAGIIIYAALFTLAGQMFGDVSTFASAMLFLVVGVTAWGMALLLGRPGDSGASEVLEGGMNAISLFGSFSIITSSFMLTEQLYTTLALDEAPALIIIAISLIITGALHIWYAFISKRTFVLLIGLLLFVSSFLAAMSAFMQGVTSISAWTSVFIVYSFLLTRATRLMNNLYKHQNINSSFDGLATLIAFTTMYAASFEPTGGGAWLTLIIFAIFGLFYLSIQRQSKKALGIASFFLIVTIITIAFRYFSGYGATLALLISAFGVLGSAIIATNINKKYIGK